MRPIPGKRHHWAVLVLLAVVAGNTLLTWRSEKVTSQQANMLAETLKRNDPSLLTHDAVFAGRWRLYPAAWHGLMSWALDLFGRRDPIDALRVVGAGTLLVYLLAAYTLLYRQTHSIGVSVLVAVMSTAIFSLKRPYWGLGPLATVGPRSLVLAVIPLVVLGFLRQRTRWTVAAVFLGAGLLGNVHLPSGVNLVLVMFLAMLAVGRFRPRVLALAAASLAAAAVGALPAMLDYARTLGEARAFLAPASGADVRAALNVAGVHLLYPGVLNEFLRWLPVAAMLAIPAGILISRGGRYRVRNLPDWVALAAAALLVAGGAHGAMQWLGHRLGTAPPVLEFFDALRLAMLPLYVLFAQAAVHLLRLTRTHRGWAQAVVVVFATAVVGSSFNVLPLRHMIRDRLRRLGGKPAERQEHLDKAELRVLARWAAREENTRRDAVFVTPHAEVRLRARRSVLWCPADVRYVYYFAPQRLGAWARDVQDLCSLLSPPAGSRADADRIVAFVDTYWARRGGGAAPTFVVIPSAVAPAPTRHLEEIPPPADAPAWGTHWRLYRVRAMAPDASEGESPD